MQHTESKFKTTDGLELYCRAWQPDGNDKATAKAALAVVHGYGEHSGRYLNLVNALAPRGYAVYAYDLRGHGKSPGPRGHVSRFDEYIKDTHAFLAWARGQEPKHKVFLLGHSLGGLIVSAYAEAHPNELPGLIMSSAFLRMKLKVPGWKMTVAKTLSSLRPTFTMANDLGADLLSHDPAVAAAYVADPLNHHVSTARWATEIFAAQTRALDNAPSVKIPTLVMYAGDDLIADPEGSALFFQRLSSADKTHHRYGGYYHEIFNEVGKDRVFADLEAWLDAHIT